MKKGDKIICVKYLCILDKHEGGIIEFKENDNYIIECIISDNIMINGITINISNFYKNFITLSEHKHLLRINKIKKVLR